MVQRRRRFLASGTGRKHSVVLSDKEYAQLMEDLAELEMIAERKDEPAEPLESVKERLAEKWGRWRRKQ